jgi:hypothetical protein
MYTKQALRNVYIQYSTVCVIYKFKILFASGIIYKNDEVYSIGIRGFGFHQLFAVAVFFITCIFIHHLYKK